MLAVSQGVRRPSSLAMPHLNINDVVVVKDRPLVLTSAAEVDALESRLWIRLPSGYCEYMERLGEGYLGIISIYTPGRIERNLVEWRRRIDKYWFWNETLDLLPKERALECVLVGDTSGGDQLIFHPCRPDRLFVLPRNCERAFEVGSNLLEAIEWFCSSGQVTEAVPEREFEPPEPHDSSIVDSTGGGAYKEIDPKGESLDDLVELGRRWVKRHSAREWRQADSDALEEYVGKGTTTELIFDGIMLTDKDMKKAYVRKYSVKDAQSNSNLGVFQIYSSYIYNSYSPSCWSYSFVEEIRLRKNYPRPRSQGARTLGILHPPPHPIYDFKI